MRVAAVLLTVLLAGCVTDMQKADRDVGANQPVEYKQGYMGGCDSGYVAAGHSYYKFSKDVTRYTQDALYKQGWDDGFNMCKSSYESVGRSMRR